MPAVVEGEVDRPAQTREELVYLLEDMIWEWEGSGKQCRQCAEEILNLLSQFNWLK